MCFMKGKRYLFETLSLLIFGNRNLLPIWRIVFIQCRGKTFMVCNSFWSQSHQINNKVWQVITFSQSVPQNVKIISKITRSFQIIKSNSCLIEIEGSYRGWSLKEGTAIEVATKEEILREGTEGGC